MRSAFIIAIFALAAFAAPVAEANPIFKSSGQGCVRWSAGKCAGSKRGLGIMTSVEEPSAQGVKSNNDVYNKDKITTDAIRNEGRAPALGRNKNSRSIEGNQEDGGIEVRSPGLGRNKNSRSIEENQEDGGIEVRSPGLGRNKNSRSIEGNQEDGGIEVRSPGLGRNKNSRSIEENQRDDGVDNRELARNHGSRPIESLRESEVSLENPQEKPEDLIESRGFTRCKRNPC